MGLGGMLGHSDLIATIIGLACENQRKVGQSEEKVGFDYLETNYAFCKLAEDDRYKNDFLWLRFDERNYPLELRSSRQLDDILHGLRERRVLRLGSIYVADYLPREELERRKVELKTSIGIQGLERLEEIAGEFLRHALSGESERLIFTEPISRGFYFLVNTWVGGARKLLYKSKKLLEKYL